MFKAVFVLSYFIKYRTNEIINLLNFKYVTKGSVVVCFPGEKIYSPYTNVVFGGYVAFEG